MGNDYITTIYYGFTMSDNDAKRIDHDLEREPGEDDGFFALLEDLEENENEVEALSIGIGMDDGYPEKYLNVLAARESVSTVYVNESNELRKIDDIVKKDTARWHDLLEKFCKDRGFEFREPEWWISTSS